MTIDPSGGIAGGVFSLMQLAEIHVIAMEAIIILNVLMARYL
jgi:hypothetical protein